MKFVRLFILIYVLFIISELYGIDIYVHNKINSITLYFQDTEYYDVVDVIIAQSIIETGWYNSKFHNNIHNYWSIKDWKHPECKNKPIKCLKHNKNIKENLDMIYKYLKRKKYSTDIDGYLNDLLKNGFAEDPKYIWKIRKIIKRLNKIKENN